jgi:hypothetical protein
MTDKQTPIACSLTNSELSERRIAVLQKAGRSVLEVRETENGCAYRFPPDDDWVNELTRIINLEKQCCPFIEFTLTAEPQGGALWLKLTGPEGTKDFLTSFFD